MDVPVLQTDRLILRGFRHSDFDGYMRIFSDPEIARYLGDGTAPDRVGCWRSLAMMVGHWGLLGYGMWAVETRATEGPGGDLIGRVGLLQPEGWPGLELGWTIRRDCQGQGYATEAARAAMDWAFHTLEADALISLIHPANAASVRVAEKLTMARQADVTLFGKTVMAYGRSRPA